MDKFPGSARKSAEEKCHGTILVGNAKKIENNSKIPENCRPFKKRCDIRMLRTGVYLARWYQQPATVVTYLWYLISAHSIIVYKCALTMPEKVWPN